MSDDYKTLSTIKEGKGHKILQGFGVFERPDTGRLVVVCTGLLMEVESDLTPVGFVGEGTGAATVGIHVEGEHLQFMVDSIRAMAERKGITII